MRVGSFGVAGNGREVAGRRPSTSAGTPLSQLVGTGQLVSTPRFSAVCPAVPGVWTGRDAGGARRNASWRSETGAMPLAAAAEHLDVEVADLLAQRVAVDAEQV